MSKIQIYDGINEDTIRLRDELLLYGYDSDIVDRLDSRYDTTILGDRVSFWVDDLSIGGLVLCVRHSGTLDERLLSIKMGSVGYYVYPVHGHHIALELDRHAVNSGNGGKLLLVCDDEKRGRYVSEGLVGYDIRRVRRDGNLLGLLSEIDLVICDRVADIVELSTLIVRDYGKPVVVLDDRITQVDVVKLLDVGHIWHFPRYLKMEILLRSIGSILRNVRSSHQGGMLDFVTGVYTVSSMRIFVLNEIERYHRSGVVFSVGLLEVDHLLEIRSVHGEEAGMRVSEELGKMLSSYLRRSDICGRLTMTRYLILFPGTMREAGVMVMSRIQESWGVLSHESVVGEYSSTISGIVEEYRSGLSYVQYIDRVMGLLDRVKISGSNRIR